MVFLWSLAVGIATAAIFWLGHIAVGLGALPAGPDFRYGYIVGCGGALLSAAAATGRGILRCLGAAVLFYLPVALMCLYLGQAWAPYPNSGKAQWDSIFLWTSIVTFFAAVVVAFLPPIRISRDDNP